MRVTVIRDSRTDAEAIRGRLAGILDVDFVALDRALRSSPGPANIFDIDLTNEQPLAHLKDWLMRKPANAKVIFLIDKTSHLQHARAYALGATDTIHRPIDGRALLNKLWGDVTSLSADPANAAIRKSPAVSAEVEN